MSDTSAFGFGKFVPGFDFLQNLGQAANPGAKGSPQGMPNMASWVAPTLNIEELDKRIQELKTVQFWLEQNTNALKATIQALEVQKMTLSTLQGMNVNMAPKPSPPKCQTSSQTPSQTFSQRPRQPSPNKMPQKALPLTPCSGGDRSPNSFKTLRRRL